MHTYISQWLWKPVDYWPSVGTSHATFQWTVMQISNSSNPCKTLYTSPCCLSVDLKGSLGHTSPWIAWNTHMIIRWIPNHTWGTGMEAQCLCTTIFDAISIRSACPMGSLLVISLKPHLSQGLFSNEGKQSKIILTGSKYIILQYRYRIE